MSVYAFHIIMIDLDVNLAKAHFPDIWLNTIARCLCEGIF